MQIDASTVASHTTRNDLIRQAAQANRSQRTFGANVLGQGARAESLSFRSTLDRVSLSSQAKGVKGNTDVAAVAAPKPTTGATPTPILPSVTPHTALSATVDQPTYTKPKPELTLPPVVSTQPNVPETELADTKFNPKTAETVVVGGSGTTGPSLKPDAKTVLPTSVVQEQMLSAFGAIEGDDAYSIDLDLDGDGMIGLNDLNQLFFRAS